MYFTLFRYTRGLCRELQKQYPQIIRDVRGWGLISGLELQEEAPITAADVTLKLMQAGTFIIYC